MRVLCIFIILVPLVMEAYPVKEAEGRSDDVSLRLKQHISMRMKLSKPKDMENIQGIKTAQPTRPYYKKGQYQCGDSICELQPGEIPPNCNGCQYKLDMRL